MKDIMKIFKALEGSGLFIKSANKTIKMACVVNLILVAHGLILL